MMDDVMMIAQTVFDFFFRCLACLQSLHHGTWCDWAVHDAAQPRRWLADGGKPSEMRAMRPDWSLESIKTKMNQLRRGASDESRPLKRRRTTEVLVEIETAVTETPRQTLSVHRRHSSLDMSRSTLWRAVARRSPSAVLQARPCAEFDGEKPLGKIEPML